MSSIKFVGLVMLYLWAFLCFVIAAFGPGSATKGIAVGLALVALAEGLQVIDARFSQ